MPGRPDTGLRRAILPAAVAAAAAAALWYSSTAPPPARNAPSLVAVLPFDNPSDDEAAFLLGDGFSGELRSRLAGAGGLDVVARASSYEFVDAGTDGGELRGIAGRLGATWLVDGSVVAEADSVRLVVRLVDGATGGTAWSAERRFGPGRFFEVQAEVAESVAAGLGVRFTAAGRERLRSGGSADPGAVRHYLGGRDALNAGTTASALTAAGRFAAAVVLDPGFTAARAGLASSYALVARDGSTAAIRDSAAARARAEAVTAIAFDSSQAEAHEAMADALFEPGRRFAEAESHYRRAIALAPGRAGAQEGYGRLLSVLGRQDEALAEFRTAASLDPFSAGALAGIGKALYRKREYSASVEAYRRALGVAPDDGESRLGLAMSCAAAGDYHDAVDAVNEAIDAGGGAGALAVLAFVYAKRGDRAPAVEILERFRTPPRGTPPAPFNAALVLAGLGRTDDAVAFLERAEAERDPGLDGLGADPAWDGVREDPRFRALLRRIGLPD